MLKNILDACGGALGFFTIGYALAYGDNGKFVGATGEKYFLNGEFGGAAHAVPALVGGSNVVKLPRPRLGCHEAFGIPEADIPGPEMAMLGSNPLVAVLRDIEHLHGSSQSF